VSALVLLGLISSSDRFSMIVPHKPDTLLSSANALHHGLELHGTWINAPYELIASLATKIHQFQEAIDGGATAETTKSMAADRLMIADNTLKAWLTKARLVVMLARGARWSESWVHTGFVDRRTQVPKRLQARIDLGRALVTFFARHPELGVPFAEVTAARGRVICERTAQSGEMLELARNDYAVMNQQGRLAATDLRNTMRKTVEWLRARLDGCDQRWADFGIVVSVGKKRGRRSKARSVPVIRFSHDTTDPHQVVAA